MSSVAVDVAALRAGTAGVAERIHLDNAGAALPPDVVHATVVEHLERERHVGGYEAAEDAADRLEAFYQSVARLLNARADEIAFVENATRAFDMAFYAVPFRPGDRILTAEAEYPSNVLAYLHVAKTRGAGVEVIPSDAAGQLDTAALERMIDARVRLIAVTHVPTHGGLVNPAAAVGEIARRHGVLYLLDACQSAGQMPLDVAAIGCDMLAATGRKYLRGPRGTGFLYVRRERVAELEPPLIDQHAARWTAPDRFELRADARRFENWEYYVAGKLGLKAAVDFALEVGIEAMWPRIRDLAGELRTALAAVPEVTVRDHGAELCGIVTFTHERLPADTLARRLRAQSINTSVTDGPAHFDRHRRRYGPAVRASVHAYNTEGELAALIEALRRL